VYASVIQQLSFYFNWLYHPVCLCLRLGTWIDFYLCLVCQIIRWWQHAGRQLQQQVLHACIPFTPRLHTQIDHAYSKCIQRGELPYYPHNSTVGAKQMRAKVIRRRAPPHLVSHTTMNPLPKLTHTMTPPPKLTHTTVVLTALEASAFSPSGVGLRPSLRSASIATTCPVTMMVSRTRGMAHPLV